MGARVLAVADTVDAMLSDRPYRETPSYQEVVDEIARCAGKQFDPQVAAAFLRVAEKQGRSFFKNSAFAVYHSLAENGITDLDQVRYLKKSMLAQPAVVLQSIPLSLESVEAETSGD
jgi:hypothetical protein